MNTEGFLPNLETHLAPVLATQIKSELLASKSETTSQTEGANGAMYSAKKAHHPLLLQVASHSLILLAAPMLWSWYATRQCGIADCTSLSRMSKFELWMSNSQMVSIYFYLFISSFKLSLFPSFSSGSDLNTYWQGCKFQILAEELNCTVEEILDFELSVCDTQPSCIGGARKEFIFSGRLDNLASSFCALRALLDTCEDAASLTDESCIRAVALFDNEEVYVSFPLLC